MNKLDTNEKMEKEREREREREEDKSRIRRGRRKTDRLPEIDIKYTK